MATINKLQYKRKRGKKTKIRATRGNLRKADFFYLMKKQNNLCANKNCAKNNDGAHRKVRSIDNMCYIIPIELWELKKLKGDPKQRSNRQLLCRTCRKIKFTANRKMIAKYKMKGK
jgi:hypothetical protein